MKSLRPLLPYFRPCRRILILGILCVIMTAILGLIRPVLIGGAIDDLHDTVTRQRLLQYGLLIIGVTFVQGLFRYAQRRYLVTMSRHIEYDLRNDFFEHLGRLDFGFYQKNHTGDLMARATNDLNAVRMLCGPAIMYSINTLVTGTIALVLMANVHLGLTLLAASLLPPVVLVTHIFGKRIHVLFNRVQEQFSELTTKVQENLTGARVVRAYARESTEQRDFDRLSTDYVDSNRDLVRWNAAFNPLLQSLVGIAFVAVLAYGGSLMINGTLTVGEFVMFHFFFGELVWPMIAIGWVINLFQRGTASLARIQSVIETEPKVQNTANIAEGQPLIGAITFDHLRFAYDDPDAPEVLSDLSFEASAGQTVAIVGRTGSGKSTLISLVPRILEPPQGALFLDGVDILEWPLADLRKGIAMVPQETFLFSTTVRENIAFGKPDADEVSIRRAASLAGLDEDLSGFPKGLDTMVGERGITLSGGQKQRVALARAILCDSRILILDDCLSAVDAHTEEQIMGNLRSVFKGRTVLFVTHRTSAARTADLIVVLDQGRIAERGTHDELQALDGLYADLHRRQQLEEELAAAS